MGPTPAEIVRKCILFSDLQPESLELLIAEASAKKLAKGQRIFRQGDPCPGLFIVGMGRVRVFKIAPNGKEHVLHLAEPRQTFAEVAAIGGFPCPAHAEAIEPTVCAFIPTDRLRKVLDEHPELPRQLLGGLSRWVRHLIGLLEDLVLRDASGRVARYLLDAHARADGGAFTLPMLKKDLASHLNLTSETLSRTLRRLADTALIELGPGNRFQIRDTGGLTDVAHGLLPAEFD